MLLQVAAGCCRLLQALRLFQALQHTCPTTAAALRTDKPSRQFRPPFPTSLHTHMNSTLSLCPLASLFCWMRFSMKSMASREEVDLASSPVNLRGRGAGLCLNTAFAVARGKHSPSPALYRGLISQ